MKLLYSSLFVAVILFPVITHAQVRDFRNGGVFQNEARQDFRNNEGYINAGYGYDDGYFPDAAPPSYRYTPQYQEETLQNAGDPMQEEELQNINDMSNEPDIG